MVLTNNDSLTIMEDILMKKVIFGLLIMAGFVAFIIPNNANAATHRSTFPRFARGIWYQYVPKKGFTKIKITAKTRAEYSHFWGYEVITLARKSFQGKKLSKPVAVSGHYFVATVAEPKVGTIMQPWVAKYTHKNILGVYRQVLVDYVTSGRVAYDFRTKVPFQLTEAFD